MAQGLYLVGTTCGAARQFTAAYAELAQENSTIQEVARIFLSIFC